MSTKSEAHWPTPPRLLGGAATAWFKSEAKIRSGVEISLAFRTIAAFRCDRLAIPEAIADRFTVRDVLIGNRSALAQAFALPGSRFAAKIPAAWRRPTPYYPSTSQPVELVGGTRRGGPYTEIEIAGAELTLGGVDRAKACDYRVASDVGFPFPTETIQTAVDVVFKVALAAGAQPTDFEVFMIRIAAFADAPSSDREVGYGDTIEVTVDEKKLN